MRDSQLSVILPASQSHLAGALVSHLETLGKKKLGFKYKFVGGKEILGKNCLPPVLHRPIVPWYGFKAKAQSKSDIYYCNKIKVLSHRTLGIKYEAVSKKFAT